MARLAFIGGTGPEGTGLAMRFAKSGHAIYIGSRSEERAAETVARIHEASPGADLYGGPNWDGALKADFVFITVPASAHAELLKELEEAIADKIVVDTVVPMSFEGDDGPVAAMPEAGSAAEEAALLLPNAKVVSAFHHLDSKQLQRRQGCEAEGDGARRGDQLRSRPGRRRAQELAVLRAADSATRAHQQDLQGPHRHPGHGRLALVRRWAAPKSV